MTQAARLKVKPTGRFKAAITENPNDGCFDAIMGQILLKSKRVDIPDWPGYIFNPGATFLLRHAPHFYSDVYKLVAAVVLLE